MAQTDSAVQIANKGFVLTGAVGATQPTLTQIGTYLSAGTLPTGFTDAGHTARDDVLAFGQDEGDSEVKGSWQKPALREVVTSTAIDYFVIKFLEITNNTLQWYYGGGDITGTDQYAAPASSTATERAVCIIMQDGATTTAIYVPKASIRREDAPEISVDEFTSFPMRFTILDPASGARLYWMNAALGA